MGQVTIGQLPRYTGKDNDVKQWADQLCSALENALRQINSPNGKPGWQASGTTISRAFNGDTATLVQTSETLNTLINDLLSGNIVTYQPT